MKMASNLEGGVAGVESICGAITGGAMAIGLIMGTEGNESSEIRRDAHKGAKSNARTDNSLQGKMGNINCENLLVCPGCTPEERAKRGEELRTRGENHCDEYVEWIAAETLSTVKKTK